MCYVSFVFLFLMHEDMMRSQETSSRYDDDDDDELMMRAVYMFNFIYASLFVLFALIF